MYKSITEKKIKSILKCSSFKYHVQDFLKIFLSEKTPPTRAGGFLIALIELNQTQKVAFTDKFQI